MNIAVWSLEFAIAVFVVACPCGIGLAAPTALLVGSGLAAKYGLLARGGGEAFQEASRLDIVVFDKTGTITTGKLQVSDVKYVTNQLVERRNDPRNHRRNGKYEFPSVSYCHSRILRS